MIVSILYCPISPPPSNFKKWSEVCWENACKTFSQRSAGCLCYRRTLLFLCTCSRCIVRSPSVVVITSWCPILLHMHMDAKPLESSFSIGPSFIFIMQDLFTYNLMPFLTPHNVTVVTSWQNPKTLFKRMFEILQKGLVSDCPWSKSSFYHVLVRLGLRILHT